MEKIKPRHCFCIYGPKVILWLLCGFLCGWQPAQAQHRRGKDINLQYYDSHFLHYGILMGIHVTRYTLLYAPQFSTEEYAGLHSVHSVNSGGFKVGFVVNGRLANKLDLRILPTVGFYENRLQYEMTNGTTKTQRKDYGLLEFPVLLKYKSTRHQNTRLYLVAGISPGFEVSQKRDVVKEENLLKTATQQWSLDVGVGLDMYAAFFKFSPEIRYSHGLSNVWQEDDNFFQRPLKSLTPHTITFYISFEGGAY